MIFGSLLNYLPDKIAIQCTQKSCKWAETMKWHAACIVSNGHALFWFGDFQSTFWGISNLVLCKCWSCVFSWFCWQVSNYKVKQEFCYFIKRVILPHTSVWSVTELVLFSCYCEVKHSCGWMRVEKSQNDSNRTSYVKSINLNAICTCQQDWNNIPEIRSYLQEFPQMKSQWVHTVIEYVCHSGTMFGFVLAMLSKLSEPQR